MAHDPKFKNKYERKITKKLKTVEQNESGPVYMYSVIVFQLLHWNRGTPCIHSLTYAKATTIEAVIRNLSNLLSSLFHTHALQLRLHVKIYENKCISIWILL